MQDMVKNKVTSTDIQEKSKYCHLLDVHFRRKKCLRRYIKDNKEIDIVISMRGDCSTVWKFSWQMPINLCLLAETILLPM